MELTLGGEPVELRPERAVRWGRTLFVADLHWGKSASFRAMGLPVPDELEDDLFRLEGVIRATAVDRVIVLGDLVHARGGLTAAVDAAVTAFRRRVPVALLLVCGNHDRHAGPMPAGWEIPVVPELSEGPFLFRHHPAPAAGRYVWAGHTHPGVRLDLGLGGVRLPCFHLGAAVGVLPAFGGFTGAASVRRRPEDVLVAVVPGGEAGPDTLYRLPSTRMRRLGQHVG